MVDAYALALAAFVLTAGSLGDRLGRRRVFLAGLSVFTLASLLCGISATATELDLARALEGVGASIGVAIAVGPLIGGVLTSGPGWRWIFFLNLPVGIATSWITTRRIVESRDERRGAWIGPGQSPFAPRTRS